MNKLFEKKFIVCDQNKIINIKVLKKHINDHNIHSIFNLLFNFQNLRDVYNNFSIIDNVFNLSNIKLSSLEVFNETYIELRKRRVCFRYRDFILIFLYNCLFLYLYIKKYHHIKNGVNNINNGYHTKKFFKATKLGSIKNFTSLDLTNSFEVIFNKIITRNCIIDKYNYDNFMYNIRFNKEKFSYIENVSTKLIKVLNSVTNNSFDNFFNIICINKFRIRKSFNYSKVIIYIGDITENEFFYLLKIICAVIKNKKIFFKRMKVFEEFTFLNVHHLHIFFLKNKGHINIDMWVRNNKYILSIDDLENDLAYLLIRNVEKFISKRDFTKIKNIDLISKKRLCKNIIYNKRYFLKKRIHILLELIKKEDILNEKE